MKWTIYCHTHIDTGRRYIGLTRKTMLARWNGHVDLARRSDGSRSHFINAIRKCGKDAFSHEVLEICQSLDVANLAEESWIELFETRNPEKGFNLARGGGHTPHPIKNPWDRPEYRAKCAPGLIERTHTPEARANNLAAHRTPESRARRSEISRDRLNRPEVKEKISRAFKGKKRNLSLDAREALRAHGLRVAAEHPELVEVLNRHRMSHDPAVRAKIAESLRGRKQTEEHKANRAAAGMPKRLFCKNGHDLNDSWTRSNGTRLCKTCNREGRRRRMKKS